MTWKEGLIGIPLAILGALIALLTVGALVLTQTEWGQDRLREEALQRINSRIQGRVEIDAIVGGDLLRGLRAAGVRLREPGGELFASVDTLGVRYRWWDFLAGDISLFGIDLVRPTVHLVQDTSGTWNAARVFAGDEGDSSPEGKPGGGDGPRLVLERVTIREGDVSVRIPEEDGAGPSGSSSERAEQDEGAPREGIQWRYERVDGRLYRSMALRELNTELPVARILAPEGSERVIQMARLQGRLLLFEEPLRVDQLRGELSLQGDTLRFDVWELALPGSRLFGQATLDLSDGPGYDIALRGDPVSAADLEWLEPRLPQDGRARLDFRMRSSPDGTFFQAMDAEWQSADARLAGQLGVVVGEARPLAFQDVELEIGRLETELLERFIDLESPVAGVISGRLHVDGDPTELDLDADLRFQPEERPESVARVGARGVLFTGSERLGGSDLQVRLDTLPFSLIRDLAPGIELQGLLTGTARFDGRLDEGLRVAFDLEQRETGFAATRVQGQGTVQRRPDRPLRIDLTARLNPLSLTTMARYYPTLPFRGNFDGEIRTRGTLSDWEVAGTLGGAGDTLRLSGHLNLAADVPRYRGEIVGRRIQLARFRPNLPQSDLDFRVEFEASGRDLDEMTGRAHVDLLSSFVGGVRFDSSYADVRLDRGRVHVDTLSLRGEFGGLEARGALALVDGSLDSLVFDLEADSLGALNPWIYPRQEETLGAPTVTNGASSLAPQGAPDGVEGSLRLHGRLWNDPDRGLTIATSGRGAGLRVQELFADSVYLGDLEASGLEDSTHVRGRVRMTGAEVSGFRLAEARAELAYETGSVAMEFALTSAGDAAAAGRFTASLGPDSLEVSVDSLAIRSGASAWRLTGPARIRLGESGSIDVRDLALVSATGRIEAGGSIGTSGPVDFSVNVTGVDLAEVAKAVPEGLGIAGTLEVEVDLSGRTRQPSLEARFEVRDGEILGASFSRFVGTGSYGDGAVTVDVVMSRADRDLFRLQGTFPLDVTLPRFAVDLPERGMELEFRGDSIPLSLLGLASDEIQEPGGWGEAEILIRGSPRDVSLVGQVKLSDGRLRLAGTGIRYRGLEGDLLFRGQKVELSTVTFQGVTGGSGVLTGTIDISEVSRPRFDLRLQADQLPAYDQLDARLTVSGTARLTGPYDGAVFEGNLAVVRGVLFIEELGRRSEIIDPFEQEFVLIDTIFGSESRDGTGGRNPFMDNLTVNVDLTVQRNTWLRSGDTNVEITGELQVRMQRAQEDLRIDGTLSAVRGDYRFLNRRFEVVEGTVEFVGTPGINPNLQIVARTRVPSKNQPVVIRAIIGGTLEDPTLRLESEAQPPINESDLVSYLLFGRPTYEITRGGANGEGNLLGGVAAGVPQAFFGYALESILVSETGIDYVDVTRAQTVGEGAARGSGLTPALAATQVEIGWYLAPRVFVSVAQRLIGEIKPSVRLEWRLTDNLTVEGVTEPRFGQEFSVSQGAATAIEQSFGLFLFYGWSY